MWASIRWLLKSGALALSLLWLTAAHSADDPKPPEIRPEQARDHVGKKVAVTMKVKASKYSIHRKSVYLDSEEDFHDEKNLGVIIEEEGLKKFRAKGIDAPHDQYKGKNIRVVGKIELRDDRPYLPLDEPDNIRIKEK
ncbi:MAG: prepilin-type N-terminal cleavage/methylation domain-containing protein [Planctomycetaceae bacterium]